MQKIKLVHGNDHKMTKLENVYCPFLITIMDSGIDIQQILIEWEAIREKAAQTGSESIAPQITHGGIFGGTQIRELIKHSTSTKGYVVIMYPQL